MAQQYFRSFNPVWNFRDLTGLPLDDTYYAFFLENTTPYQPQAVYHTPSGTIWSNPIQLTAAGTLPVDVFFDPDLVYRIEIRAGDDQSDALIWLIENYTPDGAGGGNITSAAFTSDNQMTNPQFALVNFEPSLSISSSGTYEIAPGWDLVLAGSGTATITQEALDDDNINPTNAPYALRLTLVGWTSSGTYLRQRFNQNGMLWANKHVSTSITAKVEAVNANISASLFDSNGTEVALVLPSTQIDSNYTEYPYVTPNPLPDSTNPDTPPSAYIEYRLDLPGSVDIYISSIQIVASSNNIAFNYEQETVERQLDHTFHLYRDSILFQPKESLLTGWDFALNPWQIVTPSNTTVTSQTAYTADQTIIHAQTGGSKVAVGRSSAATNYGYEVTAVTSDNRFAIIQYIDTATIRPYWGTMLSSLVRARLTTTHESTIRFKMRLIHRESVPPAIAASEPIASWSDDDDPSFTGGWTAIAPRNDPIYTLSSTDMDFPFEAFELPAAANASMSLGIVIYTLDNMVATATADFITFSSVSLVPNDFVIPATVLSFDETLRRCQFYYETSYNPGVVPGTSTGSAGAGFLALMDTLQVGANTNVSNSQFRLSFNSLKRIANPTITIYNITGTINQVTAELIYNASLEATANVASTAWSRYSVNQKGANYTPASTATLVSAANVNLPSAGSIIFHYVIDARMGITHA